MVEEESEEEEGFLEGLVGFALNTAWTCTLGRLGTVGKVINVVSNVFSN